MILVFLSLFFAALQRNVLSFQVNSSNLISILVGCKCIYGQNEVISNLEVLKLSIGTAINSTHS